MTITHATYPPQAFQKAMVFVDGTNLFCRASDYKLRLLSVTSMFRDFLGSRQIARTYLYTIEQHLEKAKAIHAPDFLRDIRVVLGDGIVKSDGNIKEKGVDALLVADLIYHAATRNCEYALVVTVDTDFGLCATAGG